MQKIVVPVFITLLLFACQRQPVSDITGQTGTDSLPTNTANTPTWHKSNPEIGTIGNFYFLTSAKGFCSAATGIYSTLDSGKTWNSIDVSHGYGLDVFFTDQQHGYFITDSSFGSTANGGNTWNISPINVGKKIRVFFVTPLLGFITTYDKGVAKTTDGGKTWKVGSISANSGGLYFINEQKGWIGIHGRGIAKTTDGLGHFDFQTKAWLDCYTINFADSLYGWTNNTQNYIYRTTDGGNTWDSLYIGKKTLDIQFINKNIGYVSTGNDISKSTDGGETWKILLQSENGANLVEVFFINENVGWAADSKGNIYRWSK